MTSDSETVEMQEGAMIFSGNRTYHIPSGNYANWEEVWAAAVPVALARPPASPAGEEAVRLTPVQIALLLAIYGAWENEFTISSDDMTEPEAIRKILLAALGEGKT